MLFTGTEIVCPSGKPGAKTIVVDLKEISKIEARIQEIQVFTKEKAPELLSQFTIAWKDLHQNVVLLTKELNDAERHANRIKGRIILDEMPKELERRGLLATRSPSGNDDQRKAMLSQSDEYEEALDRVAYIEAVIELLKGKLIAFDMAYTSIKKLISDNGSSMYNSLGNGTRSQGYSPNNIKYK